MKSRLNRNRRRKMRKVRDEATRRMRHLGLDEVPDKLKTKNWDVRPNRTVLSEGETDGKQRYNRKGRRRDLRHRQALR